MHFIETLRRWVGALTELGLVLIALGVILQILSVVVMVQSHSCQSMSSAVWSA